MENQKVEFLFFFFSCFWCFNITIVRFIRIGFNCSIGHDKFRICSLDSCRKWACAHLIQCSYSCISFVNRVCTIVYILAWLVKINCLCHQISGLAIMSATFQMKKKKKSSQGAYKTTSLLCLHLLDEMMFNSYFETTSSGSAMLKVFCIPSQDNQSNWF